MSSNSENFKTINVLYENNEQIETHPVKFYDEIDQIDANFMVQETIESLKTHINNPSIKVWCPTKGTEVNYRNELLLGYKELFLSDSRPSSSHSVRSNLPPEVEAEPQQFLEPGPLILSTKKSEGPIIQDSISREVTSQNISVDRQKEKPKSAAKSLLLTRDQNKDVSGWDVGNKDVISLHNPNSNRVHGETQVHNYGTSIAQINTIQKEQHIQAHSQIQTHIQEQVNTHNVHSDVLHKPLLQDHQTGTQPIVVVNPPAHSHAPEQNIVNTIEKKAPRLPPTGSIGTVPLDGNDPDIYSTKTSVMPFSYMITVMDEKFNPKLPPPLYIPYDILAEKRTFTKQEVLRGMQTTPTGELKLIDPEILKNQKGLITEILQSLMKSIAEGRGVVGVSLPIRIFEPRSLIERICDFWTFVPKYIIPAALTPDPVVRMKQTISMIIGGLYLSAKQLKPFNPLLGETYQAIFPNHGITLDLEHTSHHPPIANYLLTHKDFRIWGRYEFIAKLEGLTKNTVIMLQKGTSHLDFSDGHRLLYWCPHLHLEGLTHGERTAKFVGNLKIIDEKNKLKVVVKFGSAGEHKAFPKKRTDAFNGKLYRYKESPKAKDDDLNYGDLDTNICDLYGSWLEYLNIGGEETWNIDRDVPTEFVPVKDPIPSDARYREDLLWIKRNNKKYGQEWKLLLEVRQRAEKKLRQDGLRLRRHPTK